MYKLCKTEESVKRQRIIELALLDLMKTKGYENITVNELCERADVPRKAFYRYFDNKESALSALITHTMQEYHLVHEKGEGARTLIGDLDSFFKFWLERKGFLDALAKNGLMGLLVEQSISYSETDQAILDKFLPGEDEFMQKSIIKFAICGLMSAMISWHAEGCKKKTHDMAKNMCRMFSEPLFPGVAEHFISK